MFQAGVKGEINDTFFRSLFFGFILCGTVLMSSFGTEVNFKKFESTLDSTLDHTGLRVFIYCDVFGNAIVVSRRAGEGREQVHTL